jgi:hypothetical protein
MLITHLHLLLYPFWSTLYPYCAGKPNERIRALWKLWCDFLTSPRVGADKWRLHERFPLGPCGLADHCCWRQRTHLPLCVRKLLRLRMLVSHLPILDCQQWRGELAGQWSRPKIAAFSSGVLGLPGQHHDATAAVHSRRTVPRTVLVVSLKYNGRYIYGQKCTSK